jgi:hypothetical protein
VVVGFLGAGASAAFAGATVDGKFGGPGDSYTHIWSVAPKAGSPDAGAMTNATLWMTQNANGDIVVALILPKDFVDNTYGTGTNVLSSGWSSHSFSDLRYSDEAEFNLYKDATSSSVGTKFFDGDMDYVATFGSGSTTQVRSAGFSVTTGSSSMIGAAESSMGYNWSKFGYNLIDLNKDGDTSDGGESDKGFNIDSHSPAMTSTTSYVAADSAFADWQYDVVYEFSITAATLTAQLGTTNVLGAGNTLINGFAFELNFVHTSPNKFSDDDDDDDDDGYLNGYYIRIKPSGTSTAVVPLPPAALMAGAMLAAGLGRRIVRRRKERRQAV